MFTFFTRRGNTRRPQVSLLEGRTPPHVAQKREKEIISEILSKGGSKPKNNPVSLETIIRDYRDNYLLTDQTKAGQKSASSLKPLIAFFKNRRLFEINPEDFLAYKSFRKKTVNPQTINKELGLLRAALNWAMELSRVSWELVHPLISCRQIKKYDERQYVRNDIPRLRQIIAILRKCALHTGLAVIIEDWTAMRSGEIVEMAWPYLDWDSNLYRVPKSKNGDQRSVPIHDELLQILLVYKRFKREEESKREGSSNSHHILTWGGNPIKEYYRSFYRAKITAGHPSVRRHDLRHRAATRWLLEGHPVPVIMKATGHRTRSAFYRYVDLDEDCVAQLIGKGRAQPPPNQSMPKCFSIFFRP